MLVLSRKPSEQIRIGNDIVITIVKTQGKSVRLGIQAPKDVRVLRGELSQFDEDDSDIASRDSQASLDTGDSELPPVKPAPKNAPKLSTQVASHSSRCPSDIAERATMNNASAHTNSCPSRSESGWSVSSMKRRVRLATMKLNTGV